MKNNNIETENRERAARIIRIYNWTRYILMAILVALLFLGLRRLTA